MAQNIPNYIETKGVRLAIKRIASPESIYRINRKGKLTYKSISSEHHVGSFAFTMVKLVFNDSRWVVTPEMFDPSSGKKPDMIVKDAVGDTLEIHMAYELKKKGGARMEEAVNQTIDALVETIDYQGQKNDIFDIFIVIQRGLDRVFFEYHNDKTNLDEQGIPNFRGCISLTQTWSN